MAALSLVLGAGGAVAGELWHEPETFHLRGEADDLQLGRLQYLHAKGGGELAVRLRDDGTLRYLAGDDIAPECRLEGDLKEETAASLVACLLEVSPELFPGLQDVPDGVDWTVTRIAPPADDGLAMIRVRQRTRELDVQGGEAVLTVLDDRLVSYGGTLYPANQVALFDIDFRNEAEIEEAVWNDIGVSAIWVRREFDPERGEVVSYLLEKDPDDDQSFRQAVAYFETTKEIELIELGANHTADGAVTDVNDYLGAWAPTGINRRESIEVDFRGMSGGSCRMRLDSGTNHSHLIGNPKTQLADGRGKGGDPVEDVVTCGGSGFGFGGYPSTRVGRAANAHFWVRDMALFTRSSQAAYHDWYSYTEPENLRVVLQEEASCNSDAPACMWPGLNIIGQITEWRMVLAEDKNAHDNLRTMSHEMGHYVGYNYEHYDTFGSRGLLDGATEEGFADHNTLRYAMYRLRERSQRPHDSTFNTTYFTDHWNRSNRSHILVNRYNNGESGPRGHNYTYDHTVYRPWHDKSPCNENNPDKSKYECGSVIGAVYWSLAWNEIRVGFNGLLPGTELLTTSGYSELPERLANVAFTYAVRSISEDAHIDEFFDRVAERYYQFQQAGWISSAERHRINQVLTASCVGWSDHVCRSRHVTTWGVLPVMYTFKQTLSPELHAREFYRAQDFWLRGGATSHIFPDGANDTPPARYVRLDAPGEYMEKQIVVPATGKYQLHAAVYTQWNCCDSVIVEVDNNGDNRTWHLNGTGSWKWEHSGPTFHLTAGWHTLKIKYRENVSLEALFIQRVP